ncbi:unnamed protein product [Lactuca saligna]|uniref:Molybdate-anion transporter n=1 Tax=Lactuca saligna TaxID=75948 RepID=A0AA36DYB0_LACSI|nr:unnamed protein product [Lactuca saligna]
MVRKSLPYLSRKEPESKVEIKDQISKKTTLEEQEFVKNGVVKEKEKEKRASITYCITYILSCITKHSPQYRILMVGRILGGIATSLLFSAFESWLVAEHNKRGFEQQWLSITFSKAIFLGNGLVSILVGLFGNLLVGSLAMGPIAPFDAASIFLANGMAIIISSWTKNYGDSSERKDLMTQFRGAVVAIASGSISASD